MVKSVKKYLITGFSGFVSRYFIEYLNQIQEKADMLGVDITKPPFTFECANQNKIKFVQANLLNKNRIQEIILKFQPDFILHLASFSSVAFSWKKPVFSFNNNTNIFLNLLEAVRESGIKCRILSVGSSEEYGIVKSKNALFSETDQLNPISPYAVARVSQELLSKVYVDGYGFKIIMTRSFNHIGPGQKEAFVVSFFAKQMVQIKKMRIKQGILRVGNLNIVRDFLDVRDVARAYYQLLQKGNSGQIYNVCTGKGIALTKIIDYIAQYLKIKVKLKVDPSLVRPNDSPVIIGNNRKIKSELGWQPKISLKNSIADICEYLLRSRTVR